MSIALLAFAAFWWKTKAVDNDLLDKQHAGGARRDCLPRRASRSFPFLPSYWLSSALLQWAEGMLRGAAFFAAVLLSNTLFFGSIAFTRFGNVFYDTASAVQGARGRRFSN